jgi:hypothetical protein
MHANTINCGRTGFSTTPATSCSITEYGDTLTPMGSGCHQLNGYEKWYSQWLSGCNGVRVTSTGTFNLVPLGESCPGAVQVLQVPMPTTRVVSDPQSPMAVNLKNYYVELRAAAGVFDQYASTRGAGGGVTFTGPTVSIYASDDVHGGPNAGPSVWTELINMTPGSSAFTGLTAAGQSFSDPGGGATITLDSISGVGATITVTVPNGTGGPVCSDGTPLAGSGTSCDGTSVNRPEPDAGASEAFSAGSHDSGPPLDAAAADDSSDARPTAVTAVEVVAVDAGGLPDSSIPARDAGVRESNFVDSSAEPWPVGLRSPLAPGSVDASDAAQPIDSSADLGEGGGCSMHGAIADRSGFDVLAATALGAILVASRRKRPGRGGRSDASNCPR